MPANKKYDAKANCFTIRIHNADTQKLVNELAQKKGNRNAALNIILDRGAQLVYTETFGQEARAERARQAPEIPSIGRELKELRLDMDDVYVMMNILEAMLATLYNIKLDEIEDEPINAEAVRMGTLAELPAQLMAVKREILKRHANRKRT